MMSFEDWLDVHDEYWGLTKKEQNTLYEAYQIKCETLGLKATVCLGCQNKFGSVCREVDTSRRGVDPFEGGWSYF